MAGLKNKVNNSTLQSLQKNSAGPLATPQKDAAKRLILDALGQTNIISHACQHAGITRTTYAAWVASGYITQDELNTAYLTYQDYLRAEITKRWAVGEEQPLVVNGRLVYDRNGEKATVNKKDNRLLWEVAKRHLPEYALQSKNSPGSIQPLNGVPAQYVIMIDSRELLQEEMDYILSVAQRIEDKKNNVVESS